MLLTILYITFKTYIRVFFGDKKEQKKSQYNSLFEVKNIGKYFR